MLGLSRNTGDLKLSHVGSSSLTRDGTHAYCIGRAEFQPLDHQEDPLAAFLKKLGEL